jgi:D-alanine-D-alanine ligase
MLQTLELEQEEEQPPSTSRRQEPWLVAVLANIKDERIELPSDVPADALADFDHIETIQAVQAAIETDGHRTVFIRADSNLPYALKEINPDICFNLAEGLGGDAREAQVPALLEMLRIPYTGSRVTTNAISLDKTLTKRIWRDRRLPVAPFQEFYTGDEPLRVELRFPLFVKPAREGTGMGLDRGAIVGSEAEMRERVKWVINTYRQPALVEVYLPGREFTVAVMGRADSKQYSRHPEWYDADGFHRFPIMELEERSRSWLSAHAWKACNPQRFAGSNPALSAFVSLVLKGIVSAGAENAVRNDFLIDHYPYFMYTYGIRIGGVYAGTAKNLPQVSGHILPCIRSGVRQGAGLSF